VPSPKWSRAIHGKLRDEQGKVTSDYLWIAKSDCFPEIQTTLNPERSCGFGPQELWSRYPFPESHAFSCFPLRVDDVIWLISANIRGYPENPDGTGRTYIESDYIARELKGDSFFDDLPALFHRKPVGNIAELEHSIQAYEPSPIRREEDVAAAMVDIICSYLSDGKTFLLPEVSEPLEVMCELLERFPYTLRWRLLAGIQLFSFPQGFHFAHAANGIAEIQYLPDLELGAGPETLSYMP